jgi:DNA-binding CsgD family transcriptional regulator/tetratricopeptide (TPR) repeat protein
MISDHSYGIITRRLSMAAEFASELVRLVRLMSWLYASHMSPAPPTGGLVGRENELALLHGLLRESARGRGSAVLIEGEPGIGKSALVRSVVTQARDMSCETFWGTGDELGQELPLLPFLDGLRVHTPSASARRKTIVQLLRGEIATDRGADVPRALAEQLLALVTEQCTARPTVLVIDDLQWADPASVALWGRLARLAGQMGLLLVGMMRPVPQRDDLLALKRAVEESARLRLAPLGICAVSDLVESLAGGKPDGDFLELADGAAGNPLYLTELVAALARSERLNITDSGTAEVTNGSAPVSLSAAIADRLGFVAGSVRDVLRAAALLGVDFAVTDLAAVLDRKVPELIPAVDEACAAGVLVDCGKGMGFRHPLIREALYDELPGAVRAAWHREAGRALAACGAPVDRVARQLLRALDDPADMSGLRDDVSIDEWILTWLSRSADQLVGQAPRVAAELLSKAIANSPGSSSQHAWLVSRLADALFRIGDRERAEQVANRALEYVSDPDLVVDLHWTLAQCHGLAGLSGESLATLNRALTAPGISVIHRARLLVVAARTHINLGQFEEAGRVATSAYTAASEANDTWAMGWALHALAVATGVQGNMSDALPLFDRALTVTQTDPALADLRLILQINKAIALGNLDRYQEALTVAMQARYLADQVGTAIRLTQAHTALSQLLFETGRWDDALAEVAIVPENLKEPASACGELGIAAVISFHRGETEVARRHLAATLPHSERLGHRFIAPLALARSLECERTGTVAEALTVLRSGFEGNTEELAEIEDVLADGVRLAIQVGDFDTASSLAEHANRLADDSPIPHQQANALYCRGMLDHDPHKLMVAAARYEDASRPLLQAKALEGAAVEFVEADEKTQGRDAFSRSVEVYESLGAAADVQRVLAIFRTYGIRRGPHSKHRQAQSGWDSLTPMEQKIAAFVEEGLSNPDIAARLMLSRRTIGTHVSHILKKLGVSSRTDIARESALRSLAAR